MKKLVSLFMAVLLIMSLALPAMAVGTDDPTPQSEALTELVINNQQGDTTERSYAAYRILTATVSGEAFAYTVNSKYLDVLKAVTGITQGSTTSGGKLMTIEETIIQYISNLKTAEGMTDFANNLYRKILEDTTLEPDYEWNKTTTTLPQGYYLIADTTDLGTGTSSQANSLVMVDTVGDVKVEITAKSDYPSLVKKVDDENDSRNDPRENNEDAAVWRDSADYDIGDMVPFHITVNLPNNLTSYTYYAIRIEDRLSAGLAYDTTSFKIRVGPNGTESTVYKAGTPDVENAQWVYDLSEDGKILTVYPKFGYTRNDGTEASAGAEYGGDVKKITGVGNDTNIIFTYKCTLTDNAEIGNPGNPNYANLKFSNDPYSDQWGQTVDDVNIVFTYQTVINKVNTDGNALRGADFELSKFIPNASGNATHNGITGNWVVQTHKETNAVADDPDTEANEALAASTFTFKGLDDGIYKLVETKVPDGYNGAEDIIFEITAEHDIEFDGYKENGILTAVNGKGETVGLITFTSDINNGSLTAQIENRSGTELPHTGGIGTTIFYVVGAILAVGAVVLLVTKKRMGEEA